jgi:hypothetical protein
MRHCHELGECRLPDECIAWRFEIGYLELHVLCSKVLPSLEGHEKSDLEDGDRCCSGDSFVERIPTRTQCQSGKPQLVKGLQE